MHDGLEEGAGGQDDRAGPVARVPSRHDADDAPDGGSTVISILFEQEPFDHFLPQRQVLLLFDPSLHRELVELLVALGAGRVHRRAL